MDIEKATDKVKERCALLGYDARKVDKLYKQVISKILYFSVFVNVDTDGLLNDIDTQPTPIVTVDEEYIVRFTEFAEEYLR